MVKIGEWIGQGWQLVSKDLVMFAVVALIAGVLSATVILVGPMACGMYYVALKKMRNPDQPVQVGDLFKGFEVFGQSVVAFLLVMAAYLGVAIALGILSSILGYIPLLGKLVAVIVNIVWIFAALGVGALLMFVFPLVMDKRMGGWEAVQASYKRVAPEWLAFTLFYLLIVLISELGVVACGIGVLITMPIYYCATAVAYRDIFGQGEQQVIEPSPQG